MPRPILLIRYPGFPFKDHWALFIPSVQTPTFGTLLQVEGDVRSGFRHDVIRNFDTKSTENNGRGSGSCKLSFLGEVADKHVHDTPGSGDTIVGATDTATKDDIERVAMGVEAPGPSMNMVSSGEGNAVSGGCVSLDSVMLTSYWIFLIVHAYLTAPYYAPGSSLQRLPVVGAESC
jgi:hypothetical protein